MSLNSGYLDEIQANIRARPIPWEGYERAGIIDSDDAKLVKSLEQAPSREKRMSIIDGDADSYAHMVDKMLSNVTRDDVIKYMLSLAGDAARDSEPFRTCILNGDRQRVFDTLMGLLEKPSEQIHLLVARVIFYFVVKTPDQFATSDIVRNTAQYMTSKLLCTQTQNPAVQELGAQMLGGFLQVKKFRSTVWDVLSSHSKTTMADDEVNGDDSSSATNKDVLSTINSILETSKGQLQLQYYVLLILWLLTFETRPSRQLVEDYQLVPVLMTVIKNSVKEKIIRVAVAIAVNLVGMAPRVSVPSLLSHSGLSLVKTLCDRKWADEELKADLEFLQSTLQSHFDSMSTFDEYESEIIGKRLRWSPPHKSEVFWKQNIQYFKQDKFKILKPLASILTASSTDTVSLAVGCNDVGHIINELPESVAVFQKLGTKIRVMQLMNHSDADVRYEALKATQAFMAHSLR